MMYLRLVKGRGSVDLKFSRIRHPCTRSDACDRPRTRKSRGVHRGQRNIA